jgi:glycosyltransferase involved in cell wall biosynthesis
VRVVYVSTLEAGGPLVQMRELALGVAASGVEVRAICAHEQTAEMLAASGVKTDIVRMRDKFDVRGAARSFPLLRGADVVHTHDRRAGWLVRPQASARRIPVLHTMHGLPEEINHSLGRNELVVAPGVGRLRVAWLLHGYLRIEALLARTGAVVAPSRAMADFLVAHGIPQSRVRVIPHGIDVRRDEPPRAGDPPVVACVTRLEHWKGVDVLVEAAARVGRPFRLEIYGDGSERGQLHRRAEELGVDVVFNGAVEDVRIRLEQADVFVLPSRGENLPLSILEAMAAALPVVASRVGGIPELVEDGVTGVLVEPGDADALARGLRDLLEDDERRREQGRQGSGRARERFGSERMIASFVDLYDRFSR